MSIRLRLSLLYTAILALTLAVFGLALYTAQARTTLRAFQDELVIGSRRFSEFRPPRPDLDEPPSLPEDLERLDRRVGPIYFQMRDLDGGILQAFGPDEFVLPLDNAALQAVVGGEPQFEIISTETERLLVYSHLAANSEGDAVIIRVARSLIDYDQFLSALRLLLIIGSTIAVVVAFGVGWVMAGLTLRPINRITQTAQAIGAERDFGRRVDHTGPNDEIGQLATTFNGMLAELQAAYLQVEQSLKAQCRFVADASHELRTPLTTIRGNIGLLQRRPPIPDEDQAEILDDMVTETERLMRLVGDMLTLARMDTKRELRQDAVPLKPLLEDVCRQYQLLSPSKEIIYGSLVEATVIGDRDALRQVFLNLLDNGVKHTSSDAKLRLAMTTSEAQVSVSICDDGPGIAPEKLSHLFDRFYRGDSARSGEGAGLGLAIAKELIGAQHGTITVESQVEQGSVFTVTLPALVVEHQQANAANSPQLTGAR